MVKAVEGDKPKGAPAEISKKSPIRKKRSSPVKKPTSEQKHEVARHRAQPNENFQEILEGLPPEKREVLIQIASASESHSGWLPTPDYMRKYESILPGLAERIVALPEREQAHRHRVVEQMVNNDNDLKRRGQTFAMVSTVLFLALAVLLIYVGQYAWAGRVAIFGLVAVVGIFVTGKWVESRALKSEKENEAKEGEG